MRRGFSLVELSIVLVILGLLVGGILAGRSLIRASELRSVATQRDQYVTAISAFRDKYFALPGDMANAVRFWGAQAGGTADGVDATCRGLDHTSPATGQATCNGGGNGQIGYFQGGSGNVRYETFRAWQHLANAGLLEGQYAGVASNNGMVLDYGWNVPASRIQGAGFNLMHVGTNYNTHYYDANYQHVLFFGRQGGFHDVGMGPAIRPEEAWNIDSKLDDGLPASGRVMTARYNHGGGDAGSALCADSITPASANYALSDTTIRCALIFRLGF